jgi:hypothetical protein
MPWTTGVTTGADMATDFNALDDDFDALLAGFDASVEAAAVAVTTTPVDPADYALVSDTSPLAAHSSACWFPKSAMVTGTPMPSCCPCFP